MLSAIAPPTRTSIDSSSSTHDQTTPTPPPPPHPSTDSAPVTTQEDPADLKTFGGIAEEYTGQPSLARSGKETGEVRPVLRVETSALGLGGGGGGGASIGMAHCKSMGPFLTNEDTFLRSYTQRTQRWPSYYEDSKQHWAQRPYASVRPLNSATKKMKV
ncbi:hypothetical protein HDU67_004489 [Dinochytrium kinnereticum]|nr:hypothetical protein HDU67_004489 [Dinochytrium kinnereticum]